MPLERTSGNTSDFNFLLSDLISEYLASQNTKLVTFSVFIKHGCLFSWYSAQISIFLPLSDISYWMFYPLTVGNATAKNIILSHAFIWKSHLLNSPGSFFSHQARRSWPHFQMTSEILHTLCIPIHAAFQLQFPLHVGLWLWPLLIHPKTPNSVLLLSCTLYYWGSLENIDEAILWPFIHNLSWHDACWRETSNGPFLHSGGLKHGPVAGPRGWWWVASRVGGGQWPALHSRISNGSCFTSPSKIWLMGQSSLMGIKCEV